MDIIETRRLGKSTGRSGSNIRPRRVLVLTRSKDVREKIMSRRLLPATRAANLFFNEDSTLPEQRNRRDLLPTCRELRSRRIICRLDRGSLVVIGKAFFSESARNSVLVARAASSNTASSTAQTSSPAESGSSVSLQQ